LRSILSRDAIGGWHTLLTIGWNSAMKWKDVRNLGNWPKRRWIGLNACKDIVRFGYLPIGAGRGNASDVKRVDFQTLPPSRGTRFE
jgi:hypothetical protein